MSPRRTAPTRYGARAAETAGWWGPAAFTPASIEAARRVPAYSARSQHVSGPAAQGSASAAFMVAGFAALGTAQLALGRALDRPGSRAPALVLAAAGAGTVAAGAFP